MELFDEVETKFQSKFSPSDPHTPRILKENPVDLLFFVKGIISIFGDFSGAS